MPKDKTIWLKEDTYNRLVKLMGHRETFNEVVERLIRTYEAISAAAVLTGRHSEEVPHVQAKMPHEGQFRKGE